MNKNQLILQLEQQGFSRHIIRAFEKVKREDFIPKNLKQYTYLNQPLPIEKDSTISQPTTIAFMLELLELDKLRRVASREPRFPRYSILEIGSGSGYVLELINHILPSSKIWGIEINKNLVKKSRKILKEDKNIKITKPENLSEDKFDRILASASYKETPTNLLNQLKEQGVLVCPVKDSIFQFKKQNNKVIKKEFPGFIFVPIQKE
ncbi:L-isoaspartyl protein carboxyl methyltransferase [Candidatus Pacearchaeota archaeon]|nr:L-isoaspartyl protein carboxyl methyltransferase [Candidatus Pacearchaeota archaeon]|tara:strand:+ start:543 stop:1163 length:621 start_codon:yes stop_codon:yes gene_type:complete